MNVLSCVDLRSSAAFCECVTRLSLFGGQSACAVGSVGQCTDVPIATSQRQVIVVIIPGCAQQKSGVVSTLWVSPELRNIACYIRAGVGCIASFDVKADDDAFVGVGDACAVVVGKRIGTAPSNKDRACARIGAAANAHAPQWNLHLAASEGLATSRVGLEQCVAI